MTEIQVRQAPQELAALRRRLDEAGRRDLRRELNAGLRRAAKPMQAAARENAGRLPRRGGYQARAKAARMRVVPRGGPDPAIRIEARSGRQKIDLRAADSGLIRHPVFGRDEWVLQRIRQGWWADAANESRPAVRREVEAALDAVAAKIDGIRGVGL